MDDFMKVTPLSGTVYFSAKMIGQSMVHVFSIIVIFLAGVLLNGVSLSAFEWIMSGLWILLGSLPFLGIGVLVGTMKTSGYCRRCKQCYLYAPRDYRWNVDADGNFAENSSNNWCMASSI